MEHMKERWVVKIIGDDAVHFGAPWIAVGYICLAMGDDTERKAVAQAICDEHNAALDRRRAPVTMTPDDLAKAIEAAAQNIGKTTGYLRGKWEMHFDVLIGMQQWWAKEASGL